MQSDICCSSFCNLRISFLILFRTDLYFLSTALSRVSKYLVQSLCFLEMYSRNFLFNGRVHPSSFQVLRIVGINWRVLCCNSCLKVSHMVSMSLCSGKRGNRCRPIALHFPFVLNLNFISQQTFHLLTVRGGKLLTDSSMDMGIGKMRTSRDAGVTLVKAGLVLHLVCFSAHLEMAILRRKLQIAMHLGNIAHNYKTY